MRDLRRMVVAGAVIAGGLGGTAGASPARCVVGGQAVTATIQVGGVHGFVVHVHGLAVTATLPRARGPAELDVAGVIAFHGTAPRLWLEVTADGEVAPGMVRYTAGARMIADHAEGDRVVGDASLYSEDVMEGEDKPASEAIEVRVPCAELSLDWTSAQRDDGVAGDDTWWQPRGTRATLVLRAEPRDGAAQVSYRAPSCSDASCLNVTRLAQRGDWFEVGAHGEGWQVHGWLRRSAVVQLPEGIGVGRSYGCFGDHDGGGTRGATNAQPVAAHLAIGTTIYAEPGKRPWATVAQDATFHVVVPAGEAWARLTGIPGVTGAFTAYVPATAVQPTP